MVNWIHFPKNKPLDKVSAQIVKAFEAVDATIDSYTHQLKAMRYLQRSVRGWRPLDLMSRKVRKAMTLLQSRCCMV